MMIKHLFTVFLVFGTFPWACQAQTSCDSLRFECCGSNDGKLTIFSHLKGEGGFNYPSLVVANMKGDTIGREAPDLFALLDWQEHYVHMDPATSINQLVLVSLYEDMGRKKVCELPLYITSIRFDVETASEKGEVKINYTKKSIFINGINASEQELLLFDDEGDLINNGLSTGSGQDRMKVGKLAKGTYFVCIPSWTTSVLKIE